MEPWQYAALAGIGCVAGILNVVAGGGSFLTLPVLIFFGLPATVANGTNRVAILMQNVGASWGFHRHGVVSWSTVAWAGSSATLGSVLGTLAALNIGDRAFQQLLAWLMVLVTLWTLWGKNPPKREQLDVKWLAAGFFLVGVYGGFVQAGVGFLILAVTSLAGLDLVRGNAVKVIAILCFTVMSLVLFAWRGQVQWLPGLALGAGNVVGGLVGVKLTVLKGHDWIQRFVTVTVLVFAIRLWLTA